MDGAAISVDGLSKRYRLGSGAHAYRRLSEAISEAASRRLRFARRAPRDTDGDRQVWALRDVDLRVEEGEVLGVIGRNGSGKSTLLKILTRITPPTEGRAVVRGRIGSLLEVGTGFHPELTGRENVYLNGAVLGMRRAEIDRRFDEIVEFAGLARFLDTPVKRFSTGMYLRLAFAVAAHLDTETVLIDEVLAVGDLEFQSRCLGKIHDVADGGRTALFVSHQMNQIRRLCRRVLWLDAGGVRDLGPASSVVAAYESATSSGAIGREARPPGLKARFVGWEVSPSLPGLAHALETSGPVTARFVVEVAEPVRRGHHGVALFAPDGRLIWGTAVEGLELAPGVHQILHHLPFLPLRPGPYRWQVSLYADGALLDLWDCLPDLVVATRPVTHPRDEWSGLLNIEARVEVVEVAGATA